MPNIIELFAGVGGFRVGLNRANEHLNNQFYNTIWANQWEPSTTTQHAWRTYERVFGEGSCLNQNISEVEVDVIPNHDMLVGGFPCFAKGTPVLTKSGYVPIENIELGNLVLTKEGNWKAVTCLMQQDRDVQITITIDEIPESIVTTENHPFWVIRKGGNKPEWVKAKDLQVGDFAGYNVNAGNAEGLKGTNSYGHIWLPIKSINSISKPFHTYNISVADDESYVVRGISVHNCQDYSVARTLNQSRGLEGRKGVLWWEIHRIVRDKGNAAPEVLFLENVDRLVNSPAKQRGRDFAIILQSLSDLGYSVEWRIINAADYGMPQRRRRTYILAYKNNSPLAAGIEDATEWIFHNGVFAHAFPVAPHEGAALRGTTIMGREDHDLADLTEHFNADHPDRRVFETAGVMTNGVFYTCKVEPLYEGHRTTLGEIVANTPREEITEEFYIPEAGAIRESWEYQKGGKREERVSRDGFVYMYSEGGMNFPDPLDAPSRTIITSEGGSAPSRFKHVIEDPVTHRLRRLVPTELEQLDMFPVNHTQGESDTKRAFFMGNALVCGIVERVGIELGIREW